MLHCIALEDVILQGALEEVRRLRGVGDAALHLYPGVALGVQLAEHGVQQGRLPRPNLADDDGEGSLRNLDVHVLESWRCPRLPCKVTLNTQDRLLIRLRDRAVRAHRLPARRHHVRTPRRLLQLQEGLQPPAGRQRHDQRGDEAEDHRDRPLHGHEQGHEGHDDRGLHHAVVEERVAGEAHEEVELRELQRQDEHEALDGVEDVQRADLLRPGPAQPLGDDGLRAAALDEADPGHHLLQELQPLAGGVVEDDEAVPHHEADARHQHQVQRGHAQGEEERQPDLLDEHAEGAKEDGDHHDHSGQGVGDHHEVGVDVAGHHLDQVELLPDPVVGVKLLLLVDRSGLKHLVLL
mmetsp:Transcript_77679/g.206263  ORF Transcript_77679/g.206263 Transcript_77679/m.206263 type:complete len:351 (-) Transcript_77679:1256-2308(-)